MELEVHNLVAPLLGGFECKFVETLPDYIQSECKSCRLIIREPYQVDCCGSGFCRVCIESIKSSKKPCPECKEVDFDTAKDTRLKKILYSYKVYCENVSRGCQWVGELGKVDDHLNPNPSEHDHLNGCEFVAINCPYCSKFIKRSDFQVHTNEKCPRRPCICEHCNNFSGNYEAVVNHWLQCESYPDLCPNNCGEKIRRQFVVKHMQNDCREHGILCEYDDIGCNAGRITRKNMPNHMRDYMKKHMSLLEQHNKSLVKQLEDKIQVAASIKDKNRELISENQQLKLKINKQQQQLVRQTQEIQILHTHTSICPTEITITNFEQHRRENGTWYSRPFYTHPKGYKLNLHIKANGQGEGRDTHASLRIHLMKGEFDEELKWPFRANIIIEVLNQERDEGHYTKVVSFDDSTSDDKSGRVTEGEMSESGRGAATFISHARLLSKYLKNDSLKMHITTTLL